MELPFIDIIIVEFSLITHLENYIPVGCSEIIFVL